jgi:hypothetical protein
VLRFKPVIAGLLIACLAVAAVACGDDDAESQNNASQGAVDDIAARVQRNEMMVYVLTIGDAGLHGMDEGLGDSGVIEDNYVPNTRKAIRLLALTDWPDGLRATADELRATAVELLRTLQDGDAEAAAPLAAELHEGEHDFNAEVSEVLFGDLPADAGGVEEHDDQASESPEASGSPDAGATPAEGEEHAD